MSKRKLKFSIKNDPYREREQQSYPNPVPSREYLLQFLKEVGHPVNAIKIISGFDLKSPEQQDALIFRLKAMIRDGQLMMDRKNRYCLMEHLNLVRGHVVGHPDGHCFVHPDDKSEVLLVPAKQAAGAMDGDIVMAGKSGEDRRGRVMGFIHEIVERVNKTIAGRIFLQHNVYFVEPEHKRMPDDIIIPPHLTLDAKEGQIVLVEIVEYPTKRSQAIGRVIEILGDHMAPGMEIDVAIHSHGLPFLWPEAVQVEVNDQAKLTQLDQEEDRTDLRELPFVTIDGDDAQDFDDAVFCEPLAKGKWRLLVAIADVSHYVKPNTALDKEALNRGNSVYFPGRVIPMLPEILSNELCSLKPEVDRLCMVCDMVIDADGSLKRYRFYRAVILSKARLTYNKVAELLKDEANKINNAINIHLFNLYELYKILKQAREQRGALDFDTTETYIIFDEYKKIKLIEPVYRNDAHRLIEECMLIANVAAARLMHTNKIPTLYRIHANPNEDKIINLRLFLSELGIDLPGGKKPKTKDFQQTLKSISHRSDKHLIETVMLRSLNQAEYDVKNVGHFGLGYPAYTHFTSPIRRYPDLVVHRAIGCIIDNKEISDCNYNEAKIEAIGEYCSMTERRADDATRQVVSWLKCEYLQDKIGEEYQGTITGVTGFGLFVTLNEIYVEGLVHITSLPADYYQFDAVKHRLIGERMRKIYRLGDSIKVKVAGVSLDDRKIDFELL